MISRRLTEAGFGLGLTTPAAEACLLALAELPENRCGSTHHVAKKTGYASGATVTVACRSLIAAGFARAVGRGYAGVALYEATDEGRTAAALIAEAGTGQRPTPPPSPPEPPATTVAPSRDVREEAIWGWIRSTGADHLARCSQAFIIDLHELLEREGAPVIPLSQGAHNVPAP